MNNIFNAFSDCDCGQQALNIDFVRGGNSFLPSKNSVICLFFIGFSIPILKLKGSEQIQQRYPTRSSEYAQPSAKKGQHDIFGKQAYFLSWVLFLSFRRQVCTTCLSFYVIAIQSSTAAMVSVPYMSDIPRGCLWFFFLKLWNFLPLAVRIV